MARISTCVDSTIDQLPSYGELSDGLKKNLRFLRTFLIYIPKLIKVDGDLRQPLGDIVAKIDAAFIDSSNAVRNGISEGKESFSAVCRNLMDKLQALKPKIMQAYNYLSDHKVLSHSFIESDVWEQFIRSVNDNMDDVIRWKDLSASVQVHMRALYKKLCSLKSWSIFLARCKRRNLVGIWAHLGHVGISAARLSFFCWVEKEGITDDTTVKMVLDLQRMVSCSNPEVLELFVSTVTSPAVISTYSEKYLATRFVEFLLPTDVSVVAYFQGLEFLVIFLIGAAKKHTEEEEDAELISADIKSVIMETATVEYSAYEPEDYPALLQFPEKIELLKAEVFLMELLKRNYLKAEANPMIPFESLQKGLESLENFREHQQKQDAGKLRQLFAHLKMVVKDVESLCQTNCRVEDGNKDGLKLLLLVKLLKAEVLLMELLKQITAFQDQSENLHQGLQILRKFLSRPPEGKSAYGTRILSRIEEVARKASSLHHSFHFGQETQDFVTERNDSLSKLLEEIDSVRAEIEDSSGQIGTSSQFSFPETNGPGFVDYFSETLKRLVDREVFPNDYVKHQIQLVQEELESLRSFVSNEATHHERHDLRRCIINLAYEADYVIDSILLRNGSACYHMAWLSDVIREFKSTNAQVKEFANGVGAVAEEVIVQRPKEEKLIKDRLLRTTKSREIVSIVGGGGIGKTTMAKKVYNDPDVVAEYQVRAWGHVSEIYEKRQLLLEISKYVIKDKDRPEEMKDREIEDLLRKCLLEKKYLIVLDDLWDTKSWEDLALSLPKEETGSTIVITCREGTVASKIRGSNDHCYLPLLDEAQSWSLFEQKVFQGKGYSPELVQLGRSIAKDCNGLPLAIVVIADLLNQEKVDRWKEIAEDVSTAAARKTDILEVSYKHLPEEFKPCFLFLGAFQGENEILVRKLLKLWIAEGFIRNDDPNVLPESKAEEHLNGLIDRSLVVASQQTSQGGVKTVRVHSMLHKLCRSRAEAEHFLQPITGYGEHFGADYNQFKYGDIPNYAGPPNRDRYEQHRLSIYSRRNHFAMLKPSGPPVRSLLFFGTDEENPRCPYDLTFIADNFKLLRLLEIESINIRSSFPAGIELLKRLRYLAVSGNIESIPESIANLWNLETFIVKGSAGTVHIEEAIWRMQSLKHFHVSDTATFSFSEKPKKPTNLVSFSTPYISCGEDTEKLTKILPQVQKLRCKFSKSQGHSGNCNRRSPLKSFLTRLESLTVSYYGGVPHSCDFEFPSTLKKLSLSNLELPASYISILASLLKLRVLKLLSVAFDQQCLEMEGPFPELEFLKIENSEFVHWIADEDHLPRLRRLVLRSCNQLQELPESLSEMDSLKMIELQWCGQSVRDSAIQIQQKKIDASQTFKLSIDGQLVTVHQVELLD